MEQASDALIAAKHKAGVENVVLALTLYSRDMTRFAQLNQLLDLPRAEDLKWSWANKARRTLIGRNRLTGDREVQWAASGGQVKLDRYFGTDEAARFRVDWELAA